MIYSKKKYGAHYISTFSKVILIVNIFAYTTAIFLLLFILGAHKGGLAQAQIISSGSNLTDEDGYSQSEQYYPNLRYASTEINYSIRGCNAEAKKDIIKGIDIFRNKTILKLMESNYGNSQIDIACKILPSSLKDNFVSELTLGEGGPDSMFVHEDYTEIVHAQITIYKKEKCAPQVIVHELLHTFGFQHNNNPSSVMYPYLDCDHKFNEYFFTRINQLYSEVEKK